MDRSSHFQEETREHRLLMYIAIFARIPDFSFNYMARIKFIVFANRLENTSFYLSHVYVPPLNNYIFPRTLIKL